MTVGMTHDAFFNNNSGKSNTFFFLCAMPFLSLIYCVVVLASSFWEGRCSLRALLSGRVEWAGVRTVEQGGNRVKAVW